MTITMPVERVRRRAGLILRLGVTVLSLLIGVSALTARPAAYASTTTLRATSFTYDAPAVAPTDTNETVASEATSDVAHATPVGSARCSDVAVHSSTTPLAGGVATEAGTDLVPYDPEWASRQIAGQNLPGSSGYATTPGGNTLSAHAAKRTFLGGPGRAPVDPALIDDILDQGTRTGYRGLNDTVKVSAPNLCGKCYVVVDAQTGQHVVTVMVPK